MLRDAHPVSERRFGLIYFGEASGLSLCEGSADYRFRRLDGEERFDYVVFTLKVAFVRPERLEVSEEQLPKIRQRLDKMQVRYEALEKKNDFGMQNVGRSGASRFRLGADEALDELGTWLLGADDAFARFIERRQ